MIPQIAQCSGHSRALLAMTAPLQGQHSAVIPRQLIPGPSWHFFSTLTSQIHWPWVPGHYGLQFPGKSSPSLYA